MEKKIRVITRDENWFNKAIELDTVSNKIKELEIIKKNKQEELIELSKNVNSGFKNYEFRKILGASTIDYKSIPEVKTMDEEYLEEFRREPYIYWKLFKKY